MKNVFRLLCFMVYSLNVFSYSGEYRLGVFRSEILNTNQVSHIIIVGSAAKEDSDQFFQSGLSKAIRYKEIYPDHQVIILSSPEVSDRDDDKVFSDFGIFVAKVVKETFTQDKLINELLAFNKIQSLDFIGHSSPWGFKLGKKDAAFVPNDIKSKLLNLRSHLLPLAYATFNSCNSGFNLAPDLSEILSIPVAGTLTSGLFERIESDGKWYKEDDWSKSNYVEENTFSFNQNYICHLTGACVRLKPSRYNYSSYWGEFNEGGLSFSKFFCNFENTNERCETAMAMSLYSFPSIQPITLSSSIDEFKIVLYDWICQTSTDKTFFQKCRNGIEAAILKGDLVFKTHTASELNCDFKSCNAKVVCKGKILFGSGPRAHSCKLDTIATDLPTNAAREVLSFLKGFNRIH